MTQPLEVEAPLTNEQRHDQFIKASVESGVSAEDSEAVYTIITEVSPPITVENVEVMGLPLGQSQARVAREYDTTLTAGGLDGYTDLILHTPLGPVSFSVSKETLIQALTVDVPHVSPQTAPAEPEVSD
jgi:hypothetical protein